MMSVFSCLSVLSLCYIVSGSTESVPIPENVSVKSLDMGLVLKWDPPQNAANKVFNYTAEVRGWRDGYKPVCVRISSLSCDFTDDINAFGIYALRVRTELHGDASDWVETEVIEVDKITEISAPRVELTSRKGQTEVDITDPPMRKNNLREIFIHISYYIRFWKKGEGKKKVLVSQHNRVTLPDLEPLVNYCVEVAVLCQDYNKKGQFSNTTCVTNSPSGEVEPWSPAVVTLGSLVAIVLIFLAVWLSYEGCKIIFPDPKVPENLKQDSVGIC
ncbi:interleukin-10 receptor subunit beta-like isoform X2 [Pseudorasbora parva]|uniref:interleukin-10 receptor subunit beta-like isoform X2 n=1 Tax=Pseudorasbora parva TaxID=51549 RepID=UPI00351F53B7